MSYPAKLNVLVVEDDTRAKQYYEGLLQKAAPIQGIAPLRFAFSLEDAIGALHAETIFHLVIVDLRIPERDGLPPPSTELLGLRVVDACAGRDSWPIPAVLVLSAHMSGDLEDKLNDTLSEQFAYGKARVKDEVENIIGDAIQHVARYCSIGIHELEKPDDPHVPLTPREKDLIRRAALRNRAIGVVLTYFTSDYVRGDLLDGYSGWTKVFVGRFFDEDYAPSSISFFKLMPYREADVVSRDAHAMERCLPHVKVRFAQSSGHRYLLITEKVGSRDALPSSLESVLWLDPALGQVAIPKAVRQISEQLDRLDQASPDKVKPGELLRLAVMATPEKPVAVIAREQIRMHAPDIAEAEVSLPFEVLSEILKLPGQVAVKMKKCHGDLNTSNVAVDVENGDVQAYIFDASGMQRKPTEWDLAFLEVTTLLHTNPGEGSLVEACSQFYGRDAPLPQTDLEANVRIFVEAVRMEALKRCLPEVYSLLVFDVVFGQVWGLAYSGSANKVRVPAAAVRLLLLVSTWLRTTVPGLSAAVPPLGDEPDF